jgi:hypothetical protein
VPAEVQVVGRHAREQPLAHGERARHAVAVEPGWTRPTAGAARARSLEAGLLRLVDERDGCGSAPSRDATSPVPAHGVPKARNAASISRITILSSLRPESSARPATRPISVLLPAPEWPGKTTATSPRRRPAAWTRTPA